MFQTEAARQYIAAEVRAALARKTPRVTAGALSESTDISEAALSRKLNGKVGFTVDELLRIAAVLDCDPSAFLPAFESTAAAS